MSEPGKYFHAVYPEPEGNLSSTPIPRQYYLMLAQFGYPVLRRSVNAEIVVCGVKLFWIGD